MIVLVVLAIAFTTDMSSSLGTSTSNENSNSVVSQEFFKTHLRLTFNVKKDEILINQKGKDVWIETLNITLFDRIKGDFERIKLADKYFVEIKLSSEGYPEKAATIKLILADKNIDIFSFYKDSDKKYIVDFWENKEIKDTKETKDFKAENKVGVGAGTLIPDEDDNKDKDKDKDKDEKVVTSVVGDKNKSKDKIKRKPASVLPAITEPPIPKPITANIANASIANASIANATVSDVTSGTHSIANKNKKKYRDFRYGAAIVWDYPALIPSINEGINLQNKTAEYFYPISDRQYDKSEKEAHLQLVINLYKKTQYGLMNKAMELYKKKYGEEDNLEVINYLKANSLLRDSFGKKELDKGPEKLAIAMYTTLVDSVKEYDFKRGLLQYLVHYFLKKEDYVQMLQYAKRLYVNSKSNFDEEFEIFSAKMILHGLAGLWQVDSIKNFVSEKSIQSILPKQILLAYEMYALLAQDEHAKVVELFEKNKNYFQKPIHPAIIYNLAESYFRSGKLTESRNYFLEFIAEYNYMNKQSDARLRVALISDLMAENEEKILQLYRDAINLSTDPKIRYEARIRYVGLRIARKYKHEKDDLETLVFLDLNPDEVRLIDNNLKRLLWLVRLRTLISSKQYENALTYLRSIPLETMVSSERRMFEGDGAEIIHGLIGNYYDRGEYGEVVRWWGRYNEIYFDKVPLDLKLIFIVADSYIKLNLKDGLERTIAVLLNNGQNPFRSYPIWIEDEQYERNPKEIIQELRLIELAHAERWNDLYKLNSDILINDPKNIKVHYYQGVASFKLGQYDRAIRHFEEFLINSEQRMPLSSQETSLLFESYAEAIYKGGDVEKFIKTAKAVLADLDRSNSNSNSNSKNKSLDKLHERILYLYIEALASDWKKENFDTMFEAVNDFRTKYKNSICSGRVKYLLGLLKVKKGEPIAGEEIFKELLKDNSVPNYIKELSKTELSTLKIARHNI
ncbi:MAG: hypothetical protein HQK49_16660 [Oligoflexia bacterium]|nr:hypothetical protein [Oligoflexia bacterium]